MSQTIRLPQRTFLTASVGFFNKFRAGVDLRVKHILPDEHFWLEARLGYTMKGYFEHWAYYHGKKKTLSGYLSANYYWPKYNTRFTLRGDRYLLEEYGVRSEMTRHFRYAAIGFYASKLLGKDDAANDGFNGGFFFRVALPPYKYKRKGYLPRIVGGEFGFRYNAGNEKVYGSEYRSTPDDNEFRSNSFNPYYIKTELLNF